MTTVNGSEHINRLVAKKSTKKRVQPLLMSSIPSAATAPPGRELPPTELRPPASKPRPASPSVSPVTSMRGFDADIEMDMEVPIDSLEQSPEIGRGKRKASVLDDELPVKPRTLGGGLPRESVAVREIASAGERWEAPRLLHAADVLPSPPILTFLSAKVDGGEDVLEARNSEGDGPTEVSFVSSKQTQWLDYLPSPVVGLTASSSFCAIAMQDGSVSVYSHTGRRYAIVL
jgi:protein HIRA/HIR1